jgi:C4-dicarboxylate-specific signal transduction histidine kinase
LQRTDAEYLKRVTTLANSRRLRDDFADIADDLLADRLGPQLIEFHKLATLGALTPDIGHEVNHALFALLGMVELLLAEAEEGTKTHERLVLIQQSGDRIRALFRCVEEFSGAPAVESSAVALGPLVEKAVELFRQTSANGAIEIVSQGLSGAGAIRATGDEVQQVFVSLLHSVKQAMPEGAVLSVDLVLGSGWANATVSDSAPGVPAEIRYWILDPFLTMKRDLGEACPAYFISRAILRSLGGELSVGVSPSGGPSYRVRLPLDSTAA